MTPIRTLALLRPLLVVALATTCLGAVLWARSIVGGGQDSGQVYGAELSAFALDARGRIWLAGGFAGQLDLNGLVLGSDSRPDQVEPYLARLDRDAAHPVGRTFGRAVGKRDEHRVQDLHIAADGDLFLLLWTDGRVEFAGESAGGVQTPNVLAQLGPDGHPRRLLNLPLARHDLALRLALTDDLVVVSGLSDNHGTILGPDDRGSFLLALDRPRLTRSWRRSLPANLEYVGITAIADDLLLTGQFNASLTIANAELSCPAGQHCAALLRLDRAGEPRWHKRFGITGATTVDAVLADERGQSSIDPAIVNTATILLHLETPKPIVMPLPKPRSDRVSRGQTVRSAFRCCDTITARLQEIV